MDINDVMTEEQAIGWGESEARMTINAYHADIADGYGELDAWRCLLSRRNHAASFIDVPRAWRAYRDTLLAEFPALSNQ